MHGHAHMLHAQSRAKRTDDLINLLFPDSPWTNTAARLFHHKLFLISILSDLCDLSPCPPLKRAKVRNQAGSERRGHAWFPWFLLHDMSFIRPQAYHHPLNFSIPFDKSRLPQAVRYNGSLLVCTDTSPVNFPPRTCLERVWRDLSDELQYA
jgi:hypothetical protein